MKATLLLLGALGALLAYAAGYGPLLIVGGVLAVAVWACAPRATAARSATRTVHSHGDNWRDAAVHEAGHAAVAKHVGGGRTRIKINRDGSGWTSYHPDQWETRAETIAVTLAGGMAEGVPPGSAQCRGDAALIRAELRRVSWGRRGATMRQAERIAAKGLARQRGYGRRIERKLLRSGRAKG